ncbi:hypothetical protein, partial [Mesorhizobium sp. M0239]|uniref:hypothetical protein n=1 Tax=Mesorhizobium sp. M0239 TaxID=2956924 RepID=UPI00333A70A0
MKFLLWAGGELFVLNGFGLIWDEISFRAPAEQCAVFVISQSMSGKWPPYRLLSVRRRAIVFVGKGLR